MLTKIGKLVLPVFAFLAFNSFAQKTISRKDLIYSIYNGECTVENILSSQVSQIIRDIYEKESGEKSTVFIPLFNDQALVKKYPLLNRGRLFLSWLDKI